MFIHKTIYFLLRYKVFPKQTWHKKIFLNWSIQLWEKAFQNIVSAPTSLLQGVPERTQVFYSLITDITIYVSSFFFLMTSWGRFKIWVTKKLNIYHNLKGFYIHLNKYKKNGTIAQIALKIEWMQVFYSLITDTIICVPSFFFLMTS